MTAIDLGDIATGAAVLGAGGGGNPYIGRLLAREAMGHSGTAVMSRLDSLNDDDLVLPVAMMGAPTIMIEKLPSGRELSLAVNAIASRMGRAPTHVMPIEAGGINAMIPFSAASALGVPMVDADLMGRAFPELQMCTPTLYGLPASPLSVVDDKGNVIVIEGVSNEWAERLARAATVAMGCSSIIALYAMTGAQAKTMAIGGTIGLSQDLGQLIRRARTAGEDVGLSVASRLRGTRVFVGKVTDVSRETTAGFARASAKVDGVGRHSGQHLALDAQNEWLTASIDGAIVATTPDLIITLDAESGQPLTAEETRFGHRIQVLIAPCHAQWRTQAGLKLVGPRYFGIEADYQPVDSAADTVEAAT